MTNPRLSPRSRRVLAWLAAAILAPALAGAAVIVLVNGDRVEGEVVKEDAESITINTPSGSLTLPRARVKEVLAGEPGSLEIRQARESLKKGEMDKMPVMIEAAKAAGAPAAAIAEIERDLARMRAERELARYSSLLARAEEAAKRGEPDSSLDELAALLASMDKNNPARPQVVAIMCDFHLARAAEHKDKVRYNDSIHELNKAIALDPLKPTAYLELGDLYKMASGTWNEAIKAYGEALRLDAKAKSLPPAEATRAHWELGEIHRQQGKWAEAAKNYRETYKRSTTFNPRLPDRVVEAMREYGKLVQPDKPAMALSIVEEGLRVRKDQDLLELRGILLRTLRRPDDSTAAFRELQQLNPRRRMVNYYIALNSFDRGELLAGREALLREIDLFPTNYDALCLLGDDALQRDDFDKAVDYYSKARDTDKDKPRAALGLGKAHRQKKELPQARQFVAEVLSRLPEDREANLEMGRVLRDENNLEEAKKFFSEVLRLIDSATARERDELKPLKADALIARGEISLLTTGPGTANLDFQKAIEVLPEYPQAYYAIGTAFRRKYQLSKRVDDLKVAEENLKKARQFSPQSPQFALELGILYAQELAQVDPANAKGYRAEAKKNYEMYIDLGGANASQVRNWIQDLGT